MLELRSSCCHRKPKKQTNAVFFYQLWILTTVRNQNAFSSGDVSECSDILFKSYKQVFQTKTPQYNHIAQQKSINISKKILTKNSWHLAFFLHPAFFFFFSLNSRAKKETLEINTLTQSFSASTSSSFFSLMAASFFSTFSPASALDFGFSSSFLGSGRRMTFPIFWRSCMRFMASVTWEETGEQSRCSHWAVTERISHLNAAKNYLRVTKTPINTICCKVPLWAITKFLFECLRDGGGEERERESYQLGHIWHNNDLQLPYKSLIIFS